MTRRALLGSAAAAAATSLPAAPQAPSAAAPLRLAVSTYSYWHFKTEKYPIEQVMVNAAKLGFDGVEILHRQMSGESPAYLNKLKQQAFKLGLSLPMLSIHQDFVSPEQSVRQENIEHTERCIDIAAQLGIPAIRLNSGRWKTIKSFDDLMKVKGNEPPLEGYSADDAFNWCVDSIRACLPRAAKAGVTLCLENHWGLTTSIETLLKIWRAVDSPWLGINADTGNFPGDPYEGIGKLAPHATIVQAKTYYGGGEWYTLDLDYKKIAGILRAAGYRGWISLEMEGKESPETAVPKSYSVLKSAFG
ncbi:MAG: sugar phosphate isomerase/epimerase family protein [Bryobacteraceae bacterium]|nr:sugar phosphate isomerase/epimerase family protein [Bryobacteraceae bacterium]